MANLEIKEKILEYLKNKGEPCQLSEVTNSLNKEYGDKAFKAILIMMKNKEIFYYEDSDVGIIISDKPFGYRIA